jgi:hypothetical protein
VDHEFVVSGLPVHISVPGTYILDTVFDLQNVNPWACWGIVLLFVFCLRWLHYLLLYRNVAPYLTHPTNTITNKYSIPFLHRDFKASRMIFPNA